MTLFKLKSCTWFFGMLVVLSTSLVRIPTANAEDSATTCAQEAAITIETSPTKECESCCRQSESFPAACIKSCKIQVIEIRKSRHSSKTIAPRSEDLTPMAKPALTAEGCTTFALNALNSKAKGKKGVLMDDAQIRATCQTPPCNTLSSSQTDQCVNTVLMRRSELMDKIFPTQTNKSSQYCHSVSLRETCCKKHQVTAQDIKFGFSQLDENGNVDPVNCFNIVKVGDCDTTHNGRARKRGHGDGTLWLCQLHDPRQKKAVNGCWAMPGRQGKLCCPHDIQQGDFTIEDDFAPGKAVKWASGFARDCAEGKLIKREGKSIPGYPMFQSDCTLPGGQGGTEWGCEAHNSETLAIKYAAPAPLLDPRDQCVDTSLNVIPPSISTDDLKTGNARWQVKFFADRPDFVFNSQGRQWSQIGSSPVLRVGFEKGKQEEVSRVSVATMPSVLTSSDQDASNLIRQIVKDTYGVEGSLSDPTHSNNNYLQSMNVIRNGKSVPIEIKVVQSPAGSNSPIIRLFAIMVERNPGALPTQRNVTQRILDTFQVKNTSTAASVP